MNVFQCSNEFYPFQRRVSFSATVCLCARGQIRMCSWRGRRTGTDSSIREFSTRLLSRRCSTASLSSMRALPRDLFRFEKRNPVFFEYWYMFSGGNRSPRRSSRPLPIRFATAFWLPTVSFQTTPFDSTNSPKSTQMCSPEISSTNWL